MKRLRPSLIVICVGLGVLAVGAALLVWPWLDASRWAASPEAVRAERNADAPTLVIVTPTPETHVAAVAPTVSQPVATALATPVSAAVPAPAVTPVIAPPQLGTPISLQAHIDVAPTATPAISDLKLGDSSFEFDDPPQPGAHVHLNVSVHNPTEDSADRVVLAIPSSWLRGYKLEDTTPALVDGSQDGTNLSLSFDGPAASEDLDISLAFVTTDEVIDSPNMTVWDGDGRKIGSAHPPTSAPTPRPGPIYSIDIPKLNLHSGVVPVVWEPPLFVVGQIKDSANVSQGNSVLVGHVRGAAGYNVFIHLDQLQVGDAIVANSRGAAYNFVVTRTEELPEDDTSPTDRWLSPRLTLMTCAGQWNPLTQDYSDRLWVTAQPEDAAKHAGGTD